MILYAAVRRAASLPLAEGAPEVGHVAVAQGVDDFLDAELPGLEVFQRQQVPYVTQQVLVRGALVDQVPVQGPGRHVQQARRRHITELNATRLYVINLWFKGRWF